MGGLFQFMVEKPTPPALVDRVLLLTLSDGKKESLFAHLNSPSFLQWNWNGRGNSGKIK